METNYCSSQFSKKQIADFMSECLVLGSVGEENDIVLLTSDIPVENGVAY